MWTTQKIQQWTWTPGELQSGLDNFFSFIFHKENCTEILEAKVVFIRKLHVKEKQIWPHATHAEMELGDFPRG